ncbi:MAG: DedA family protein [Gammaproteobacteria bacterium]|nr:DedA family protein [Gammaproteobacteria bacterium]
MELLYTLLDFILHPDNYLSSLLAQYGAWVYGVLFLIVFAETGLVVTPFLPGDSLLFVAGTLTGAGQLDVGLLMLVLFCAAVMGDNTNYWIGRWVGPRVFSQDTGRLLRREHLERTQHFYERYGGRTVIIARFVPIVRTFAPFVAGVGRMHYPRFLAFSVIGTVLWVGGFVGAGHLFGNLPVVKENLTAVILIIIVLSILPGVIEYLRARRARPPAVAAAPESESGS